MSGKTTPAGCTAYAGRTTLFAFSDSGCALALRLCGLLGLDSRSIQTTEKYADKYGASSHKRVCAKMGEFFAQSDVLIFVCACGIAVRDTAPYLKSKTEDPAVIVIDDKGQFVIPILSGHIGGANRLSRDIAAMLGAVPVITTATDIHGRFSADEWAARQGLAITSQKTAKDILARILTHDIGISSEFSLPPLLPDGLIKSEDGEYGIYIGIKKAQPYAVTLRLVPRVIRVGIGCRRGISSEAIHEAVRNTFDENGLDMSAIRDIASVDIKSDEAGLLEYAASQGVPCVFLSSEELGAQSGDFSESEFVRRTVGVGNVCERAAVSSGGELIVRKTVLNGVTVAAALSEWRISFE